MMIQRKEYLKKLIAFRDKQLIKVVTGVRRCGKSTLLKMYQEWLREQGVEASRIISINFEDIDYEELTDYRKLYDYLKEHLNPERKMCIRDRFPALEGKYLGCICRSADGVSAG